MLQHADPSKETVTITRPMFERIEDRRKEVAENEHRLNRIAEDHKAAKKAFDASRDTLDALVSEMIRVVNGGPSDLPLFDNMNDRLEEAQQDPVAQGLLKRLLDHGYSALNLLIVHGYTEAERGELATYLDSLDARDQAHAKSLEHPDVVVPDPLPEPAFISAQAIAEAKDEPHVEIHDDLIAILLAENGIEFMPGHAYMSHEQRVATVAWAEAAAKVREEKRENLTFDDLPAPPACVLDPKSLIPAELTVAPVEDDTPIEEPKKARAKRRSSKEFKNTPRVAKAKKGKKS